MLDMAPENFYDMLPVHFWGKLKGFFELEDRRERGRWERARWSTCLLLNMQISKGKKLKLTDLFKFDDEKKGVKQDYKKLKADAEYFKKMGEYKINKKDGK